MTVNELGSDFSSSEQDVQKSVEQLLLQPTYTPSELSTLLDVSQSLIEHDAFNGALKAEIIEHDIISIRREDALAWLNDRE